MPRIHYLRSTVALWSLLLERVRACIASGEGPSLQQLHRLCVQYGYRGSYDGIRKRLILPMLKSGEIHKHVSPGWVDSRAWTGKRDGRVYQHRFTAYFPGRACEQCAPSTQGTCVRS